MSRAEGFGAAATMDGYEAIATLTAAAMATPTVTLGVPKPSSLRAKRCNELDTT